MDADRRRLISDLRSQLAYHLDLGITEYLQRGDLHAFLAQDVQVFSPPMLGGGDQGGLVKPAEVVTAPDLAVSVSSVASDGLALVDIAAEVGRCRSCPLHEDRRLAVAGQGGSEARLLIVGGWLTALSSSDSAASGLVFGREEDRMLAKMVGAIHLRPEECFVTNIIKCGIGPESQPRAEHIAVCLSYLHQQIETIRPDVICAMGPIAVRALLGQQHSLSRLRGRFYPYETGGRKIQLMPTYHPTYLSRNPEMKRAVWADLQAIEKMMAS